MEKLVRSYLNFWHFKPSSLPWCWQLRWLFTSGKTHKNAQHDAFLNGDWSQDATRTIPMSVTTMRCHWLNLQPMTMWTISDCAATAGLVGWKPGVHQVCAISVNILLAIEVITFLCFGKRSNVKHNLTFNWRKQLFNILLSSSYLLLLSISTFKSKQQYVAV